MLLDMVGTLDVQSIQHDEIEWASALVPPTPFFSFSELRMELLLLLLQRVEPKLGGMLK